MSFKVRFTFSDSLMEENNIKREAVYYTLKKNFLEKGLVCVSDDDVLMFEDTGNPYDYGNMWSVIMGLIKSDWFDKCASSCDFIGKNGKYEDILIQIPELKQILGIA